MLTSYDSKEIGLTCISLTIVVWSKWVMMLHAIKMFDGVVRVLSNVRHVSVLRKNLISFNILDDLDYGYSSKGGIIKITKCALTVIKG